MKIDTDTPLLRKLRRLQGKRTQKELASDLGITPAYLCDIYKGNRNPGKKVAEGIAALKQRRSSCGS